MAVGLPIVVVLYRAVWGGVLVLIVEGGVVVGPVSVEVGIVGVTFSVTVPWDICPCLCI